MANKDLKISQLTLATGLDGGEMIPFAKDNGNGALTASQLKAYAREGMVEEGDLANYVPRSTAEAMARDIADMKRQIQTLQTRLNQIPAMPLNDDKCYALQNGEWVMIADVTETLLTANDDMDEKSEAEPPA